MNSDFEQFPLKPALQEGLRSLKYNSLTPIQEKSLPVLLMGRDVIAQAKTGSGKTAAFGLTILNTLEVSSDHVHGLVLVPTRELADQVSKEIRSLAASMDNVKVLTLCGGSPEAFQKKSLSQGAHIIIGTPGRVFFHLKKGFLKVEKLKTFVLDEADRMLDMGFNEAIKDIASFLPAKRQTLLFSATYPENILSLSEQLQHKPAEIKTDVVHEAGNISEIFYKIPSDQDKNDLLYKLLGQVKPERAIVFCRTKKATNDVAEFLMNRNISAQSLNGDLEQNKRIEIMTKFSNKSLSILVATDIAARGLDIEELPAVFNYNMPSSAEDYVHRIGRTGRAGKTGFAISFVENFEKAKLTEIENLTNKSCDFKNVADVKGGTKFNLAPTMKTIYISGGRKSKIRRGDILGALVQEAKIESENVGQITVFDQFSYVALSPAVIDQAIMGLNSGKIKKKKFRVGRA